MGFEYLGAGSGITKGLYHLNGNSNDSSGNGNNGTDTSISYVAGKFGNCASFNGGSSVIQTVASLRNVEGFVFSAWINTAAVGATRSLYSLYYQASIGDEYRQIRLDNNGTMQLTDMSATNTNTNTALSANIWYLFTLVRKSATSFEFYINGILDKAFTQTINKTASLSSSEGTSPRIGRGGSFGQWWSGLVDEVIIENRAWTAQEIQKYYTFAKGRFGIQ